MSCLGLGIDRENLSIDKFEDVSVFCTEFDDRKGSFNLAFKLCVDDNNDSDISDVSTYVSNISPSNIFKKKK